MGTGGTAARPAIMFRDRRAFLFGSGAVWIRARGTRLAVLLGALPVALAALAVARLGIETRGRGLEKFTAVELRKALEAR